MNEARIHRTADQIKNRWRTLKAAYKRYEAKNGKVVLIPQEDISITGKFNLDSQHYRHNIR